MHNVRTHTIINFSSFALKKEWIENFYSQSTANFWFFNYITELTSIYYRESQRKNKIIDLNNWKKSLEIMHGVSISFDVNQRKYFHFNLSLVIYSIELDIFFFQDLLYAVTHALTVWVLLNMNVHLCLHVSMCECMYTIYTSGIDVHIDAEMNSTWPCIHILFDW